MRRFALLAAFATLAAACGPNPGATPGASPSPGASKAPSTTASTPIIVSTPTPRPTPMPVTLTITVDGKPANVQPVAWLTQVPGTGNASLFWEVGGFANATGGNIGRGIGRLKEGEGNVTIHMKMPLKDDKLDLRTLTEGEFAGAANMTYKEGPSAYEWYANGQTDTSGSFTVEGGVITFKMTAEIAGDKRGNDGTARKLDITISGLPKP